MTTAVQAHCYLLHYLTNSVKDQYKTKSVASRMFNQRQAHCYVWITDPSGKIVKSNCSLRPVTK